MIKNIFFFFFLIAVLFSSCVSKEKRNEQPVENETIELLNKQIEEDPGNSILYYKRAQLNFKNRHYKNAISDINKAVSTDSTKTEFYSLMGDLYFLTNQVGSAENAFLKSIALDETNINALLKEGQILLYLRKNKESIALLDKVLKIDIHNAQAYFMKGMNFKELKDTVRALSSFQTAIEQSPEYYPAYIQLGMIHASKRSSLAIGYYQAARRLQPDNPESYYNLAMFYQETGEIDNAMKSYTDLTLKFPKYKQGYFNMGYICQFYKRDVINAIKHYTAAIDVDPGYVEARFNRALAFEEKPDVVSAKKDYQFILQINPDFGPAKKRLQRIK